MHENGTSVNDTQRDCCIETQVKLVWKMRFFLRNFLPWISWFYLMKKTKSMRLKDNKQSQFNFHHKACNDVWALELLWWWKDCVSGLKLNYPISENNNWALRELASLWLELVFHHFVTLFHESHDAQLGKPQKTSVMRSNTTLSFSHETFSNC